MMGIPLMSGFASKWMLYTAALQAGWIAPALAAWIASLGTVFCCIQATDSVFLGSPTEASEHAHEAPFSMQLGLGLVATGSLVLGIAPQLAVNYLLNPVLGALGLGTGIQVTWFGLTATAGSWFTTWGLVLAVVSLIFGGLVYAMASSSRHVVVVGGAALAGAGGSGVFTGGEPFVGEGRLPARDFSYILAQSWSDFFRWSNVDGFYLGVWRGMLAISSALGQVIAEFEQRAVAAMVVLAAVVFAGVRFFAPQITASESTARVQHIPHALMVACAVSGAALILAALSSKAWQRFAPLMSASAIATVAGLAVPGPSLRLGLLELGAVLAVLLVWSAATQLSSRLTYLCVIAISALSLIGSDLMTARGDANTARALLITSIFVKLAVVPFFVWLLKLADELPALVLGLIIAVLDIAAFGEFYAIVQVSPWMITPMSLWLGIAAASAFISAILMLSQRDLKRLLVLSSVEDIGFLMLGLASANALGMSGAMLGAVAHALAKALLFACLSAPEGEGALSAESTGLTVRYPFSGFGFVFGMLAMLGVPPTIGFLGRWRLYDTALQIGPWMLAVFVLSSALALIAFVLALTRCWWGSAPDGARTGQEPVILKVMIVLLVVLLLAGGLWPNVFQAVPWGMQ